MDTDAQSSSEGEREEGEQRREREGKVHSRRPNGGERSCAERSSWRLGKGGRQRKGEKGKKKREEGQQLQW